MDKNEYNLRLAEIEQYVDQGDYAAAAKNADTIEWKRVRNVRTLCMVSEIYEAVGRYDDSKKLLLRAYKRSPVGRTILYRLVEVTIHLKQFDEAIEYYTEYVHAAPHDNNRYILKYEIYRGRGSSIDEQIEILKEFLSHEYNEKYAYELARLYREADRIDECLTACDDLVLWFHSGKYVIKALELKREYRPLTPKQQEIYDHRFDEEPDHSALYDEAENIGQEKNIVEEPETTQTQAILDDTQREIAMEIAAAAKANETADEGAADAADAALRTTDASAVESARAEQNAAQSADGAETAEESAAPEVVAEPQPEVSPEELASRVAESMREITSGIGMYATQDPDREAADAVIEESKRVQEETAEQAGAAHTVADTAFAAQATPVAVPERETAEVAEHVRTAAERATAERAVAQQALAPQASAQQASAPQASASQASAPQASAPQTSAQQASALQASASQASAPQASAPQTSAEPDAEMKALKGFKLPQFGKKTAAPAKKLTIDDVLLSMGERGEAVREAAAKANTQQKQQPDGVLSAVDEALLNMNASKVEKEPEISTAEALGEAFGVKAEAAVEEMKEVTEAAEETAENVKAIMEETAAEAAEAAEKVAEETVEETAEEAETADEESAETEKVTELSKEAEAVKEAGRELAAAFAKEAESAAVKAENNLTEAAGEEDILTAKTRVIPTEEIARLYGKTPIEMPEDALEAADKVAEDVKEAAEEAAEPAVGAVEAAAEAAEDVAEEAAEAVDEAIEAAEAAGEKAAEKTEEAVDFVKAEDLETEPSVDQVDLDDEEPLDEEEAEEEEKEPEAPRRRLAPQVRDLFDGFLEIDHLEDQIAYAIEQSLAKNGEKTSRAGNIVIFGGHGCGKTTIAIGIAKAIAQLRGDRAVKMARIYATDLNRKDIPKTIAKIAGGILIVEEAGDLDDQIADQLTTAMEFRTDGMIMILEDEQKYIRELLNRHPRFTMKFTSQIYIPIFTPNELIDFAQGHADEQGYTLGESAEHVLAEKIEKLGAEGEPVSITNMNELVDNAIVRANKFGRKMFGGKNRYDERGRVILLDKDFR